MVGCYEVNHVTTLDCCADMSFSKNLPVFLTHSGDALRFNQTLTSQGHYLRSKLLLLFFFLIFIFILCALVFLPAPTELYVCKGVGFPGTGVTDSVSCHVGAGN